MSSIPKTSAPPKPRSKSKLDELFDQYGMTETEFVKEFGFDSVCPGICKNAGCDYTAEVEPDCWSGYCEACGTQTVVAAMVMMGAI